MAWPPLAKVSTLEKVTLARVTHRQKYLCCRRPAASLRWISRGLSHDLGQKICSAHAETRTSAQHRSQPIGHTQQRAWRHACGKKASFTSLASIFIARALLVAAALRDLPGPPRLLTARQQFPAQSYTKIAAPGLPIHRTASSSCAIHHCGDFGCCPAFSGLTSRRSEQIARPSKSTSADSVRLSFQPGRDQGSPHVTSQANPFRDVR